MFKNIDKTKYLILLGAVTAVNASVPNPVGDYIGVTDINDTAVHINFEDQSTNESGFHISGDGIDLDLPDNNETANSTVYATFPFGTGTLYFLKISFAWYSWIFITTF